MQLRHGVENSNRHLRDLVIVEVRQTRGVFRQKPIGNWADSPAEAVRSKRKRKAGTKSYNFAEGTAAATNLGCPTAGIHLFFIRTLPSPSSHEHQGGRVTPGSMAAPRAHLPCRPATSPLPGLPRWTYPTSPRMQVVVRSCMVNIAGAEDGDEDGKSLVLSQIKVVSRIINADQCTL